jgi:hypothetical protein
VLTVRGLSRVVDLALFKCVITGSVEGLEGLV